MYRRPASPFEVGLGILLLFIMGLAAIDGEISGRLFGRGSPVGATHTSQGILITLVGWIFIATALLLTIKLIRGLWKK